MSIFLWSLASLFSRGIRGLTCSLRDRVQIASLETEFSLNKLNLFASCEVEMSIEWVLEPRVYMAGVSLVMLIVLSKDMAKLEREARLVNSSQDISRESQMFCFKH